MSRPFQCTSCWPASDATGCVELLLGAGADRSLTAGPEELTALEFARRRRDAQTASGKTEADEGFRNYDSVIELLEG